jgi:hypothetical protein
MTDSAAPRTHPFLLEPAELKEPVEPIFTSPAVHRVLRGWLIDIGHPRRHRRSCAPRHRPALGSCHAPGIRSVVPMACAGAQKRRSAEAQKRRWYWRRAPCRAITLDRRGQLLC